MTAQTAAVPAPIEITFDPRTLVAAGVAVVAVIGIALAPALTFFVALTVVAFVALDRAATAANEELESLAIR
jgi:hypothetical protein